MSDSAHPLDSAQRDKSELTMTRCARWARCPYRLSRDNSGRAKRAFNVSSRMSPKLILACMRPKPPFRALVLWHTSPQSLPSAKATRDTLTSHQQCDIASQPICYGANRVSPTANPPPPLLTAYRFTFRRSAPASWFVFEPALEAFCSRSI